MVGEESCPRVGPHRLCFIYVGAPLSTGSDAAVGPILRNVVRGKNRYGQKLSSDFSKLMAMPELDFSRRRITL
ncbi:hypothetical protein EMIT0P260_190008 [Pseudomonas sp. IT-P260]